MPSLNAPVNTPSGEAGVWEEMGPSKKWTSTTLIVARTGWALGASRDAERGGIDLGVEGLEQLMRVSPQFRGLADFKLSTVYPPILPSLLIELSATSIQPTLSMYNAISRDAIVSSNLEQLVMIVHELFERDMIPSNALLKHIVRLTCEWGCPRLALQITEKVEANSRDGTRADTATWIQILMSSADNQFVSLLQCRVS